MATVAALVAVVAMAWPAATASGQPEGGPVHHTSLRVPVLGPGRDLGAMRAPGGRHAAPVELSRDAHRWQLVATIPGAVIHDISFATPRIGYAAAELGQVWKTNDGGTTWREMLNLGFPFYWYGVHALTAKDVVVSGFDDSNFTGILRWTHDGGTTCAEDRASPTWMTACPRWAAP